MKTLILSFLLIFGEEVYVNDIPFNTNDIAVASILDGDELRMEEEAYVDDIPFDTEAIAGQYLHNTKIKSSDEANINDLPFNTEKVFYEKLTERLTEEYRDEAGINDVPAAFDNTFCCYKINVPRSASDILKVTAKE